MSTAASGTSDDQWDRNPVLAGLPAGYRTVRYVGARYPGSAAVTARPGLEHGGNCQLFAYRVLERFGVVLPPFRSRELWADRRWTVPVPVAAGRPLDLVLFSASGDAWGAHVGVWIGGRRVLHLCAEMGRPAVWSLAEFARRERYRELVGLKRGR